jgi:O-acetylhomoserine (thiol)-lyase
MLLHYVRRFGIDTTVKPGDLDGWRAAVRPNTKLVKRLGNPGLDVLDIERWPASRRVAGAPL